MVNVNLKALSESLGLTEGTVSRALNDYPDISIRTRKRVKETASLLGYSPNSSARRLATGNAECIGYVLPGRSGHISDPLLAEVLDGMSEAVSERHWDLTVASAKSPDDELAVINRLARSGRVNGLVISRTAIHDKRIECLKNLRIPFVAHGRTADCGDFAWFDIDSEKAFCDATMHLGELGHKRIAHIRGPEELNFVVLRQKGYRKGLQRAGIKHDPVLEIASSDLSDSGGYDAMRFLLALADRPTAVVCVSDMVAIGALKAIHEAGLQPGREISVIGYDGLPMGEHTHPPLSTMEQPSQTVGKKIGEMLLAVIDGDEPKSQQVLWQASLKQRETVGPPL